MKLKEVKNMLVGNVAYLEIMEMKWTCLLAYQSRRQAKIPVNGLVVHRVNYCNY